MDQQIVEVIAYAAPVSVLVEERTLTEANKLLPVPHSADLAQTYSAIVNAITATVLNADAGLQWLDVQPENLEEVRRSLRSIAGDGQRAAELVARLRSLVTTPTLDVAGH